MACMVCPHQAAGLNCQFSLETALENIRKHYKSMETSLEVKSKQVKELTERNTKLMKAIDCLKKPDTLARLNSFSEQCDRPTHPRTTNASQAQLPSPIFEDITIIDDDEEDNALVSVMDTALNGSVLNTTVNNEVITETERPNQRGPHTRRLALKSRTKSSTQHKKCSSNDENKKPPMTSPPPPPAPPIDETQDLTEWTSKQKIGPETPLNTNKSIIKRLSLKQTRLPFEEKRERSPSAGTSTSTLTLGRFNNQKQSNTESDEDVFDFNKSDTFHFKSPTPKKSKFYDSKTDVFNSPQVEDASVIAIASPTQTIHFLDDTTDDERQEPQKTRTKVSDMPNVMGEDSADSLADFDMPDAKADKIKKPMPPRPVKTVTAIEQHMSPIRKIKKEPLTQQKEKKPINPVFKDSDTAEESDDEFIVRPIQVKVEPEQKNHIDIDSIDCADCRNYIKFCGERMTVEKLQEHIRNCVYHNERDNLRAETPDGFWNPLLLSFNTEDPRNEVLIDDRFAAKKIVGGTRKNS